MKNRKTIITVAAICMGLAMGFGFAQAGDPIQVPDKSITIKGKKPVKFKHNVHLDLGVTCGQCHHDDSHNPRTAETIGTMADSTALQCATCHNSDFANPKLQKAKDIFHANCKTCHKAGFNDKKGPTKCSGCHVKKKRAIEGC
jgi:hypothetical protein